MRKAQKQFDNKMTKFVVVDGVCYLEQISNLFQVGFDDLPKFVVYDAKTKKAHFLMDTLDANGFVTTVVKVTKGRHNLSIQLENGLSFQNMDCPSEVARIKSKMQSSTQGTIDEVEQEILESIKREAHEKSKDPVDKKEELR